MRTSINPRGAKLCIFVEVVICPDLLRRSELGVTSLCCVVKHTAQRAILNIWILVLIHGEIIYLWNTEL